MILKRPCGVNWDDLSPGQQRVLDEAADDLEVGLWELAAVQTVIMIDEVGREARRLCKAPPERSVVVQDVLFLLRAGLVALARRQPDPMSIETVLVPEEVWLSVLNDPASWDPIAGRYLLIEATEVGQALADDALLGSQAEREAMPTKHAADDIE